MKLRTWKKRASRDARELRKARRWLAGHHTRWVGLALWCEFGATEQSSGAAKDQGHE